MTRDRPRPESVRRVRVFVSSPGDVAAERQAAHDVVRKLGKDAAFRNHLSLDPILWDDPEAPAAMLATLSPQESVNRGLVRPSECEVVIAILWSRMGTSLDTPRKADGSAYLSGTEWEFEDACRGAEEADRKVLLYRRTTKPPWEWDDPDLEAKKAQFALVKAFFDGLRGPDGGRVGVTGYSTVAEFGARLETDLRQILPSFVRRPAGRRNPASSGRGRRAETLQPAAPATLVVPDAYREWLKKETASLELLGLGAAQGRSLFLNAVYVPLTTTGGGERKGLPTRTSASGDEAREERSPLLLHALGERSLYVPGAPGSGKSTFCRWVAWLACEGALPPADVDPPEEYREALPEALRDRLPVLVPLREFWDALPQKPAGSRLGARELIDTLKGWLDDRTATARGIDLRAFLDAGRTLVIFDGVDEVPTAVPGRAEGGSPRDLLISALSAVVQEWTRRGNCVLVTSRPHGLDAAAVARIGLEMAPIEELPGPLQHLLAQRWFRIQKQDAAAGDAAATDLMRDAGEREWLRPLAANPLMLTAMCAIYADGGRLPEDRHLLYDAIVTSVLIKRYPDPKRRARVRFELCAIAHAMHTGEALGASHAEPLARATFHEAEMALRDEAAATARESVLGPRDAREDLLAQSGLLTALDGQTLSFVHFSLQEFLAAERMFDVQHDALRDAFVARAGVPGWRNTLSFLYGRYLSAFTGPSRPLALLQGLIDAVTPEALGLQLVAGDCAEMALGKGYLPDESHAQRLRASLHTSMTSARPAKDRCDAGTLLGKVGDPRFDPVAWYLPHEERLGFVPIPAGPFLMGKRSRPRLTGNRRRTAAAPGGSAGVLHRPISGNRRSVQDVR